jgi:hypothetical protein
MNRKLKERERLARRDVETVRRMLLGKGVVPTDLLMLQRAHDRLLEVRTAEINETLNKPARDALKGGRTPEGLMQFEIRVPHCLYHGTRETAAANILSEGIVPRSERGAAATHEDAPSHPNCVYLTDCHALGFSWDAREGGKERSAIFEVDLEPLRPNLLPDEDAVGASGLGQDPSVIENMAKDDREFLRNVVWRSLHWHGSVAHHGIVPLSAIRRVAYIPLSVLNLVMTRWKTKLSWGRCGHSSKQYWRGCLMAGTSRSPFQPRNWCSIRP